MPFQPFLLEGSPCVGADGLGAAIALERAIIPQGDCIPQLIPRDLVIADWSIHQQMPAQFLMPLVLVLKGDQSSDVPCRRFASEGLSLPMSWKTKPVSVIRKPFTSGSETNSC